MSIYSQEEITDVTKKLKRKLSHDRFIHTIGVANTALALAMSQGIDYERAYLAGLLHDCAKDIPDEEKLKKCEKFHIPVTATETENPSLLHAKLGAYLAADKYNITDYEILSSIECHTTGKPEMTQLEMIIFVADYIEPGRDRAKELTEIRKEAFENLTYATYHILKNTLDYLKQKDDPIDPQTEITFNYYKEIIQR